MLISLVVPCYNEEESLPYFYAETTKVIDKMSGYDAELIFINDGSTDGTLDELKRLAEKDSRVKYL